MENKIEFLKEMQILNIQEGDILIIKINQILSEMDVTRLKELINESLPKKLIDKIKMLILEADMDIGILRDHTGIAYLKKDSQKIEDKSFKCGPFPTSKKAWWRRIFCKHKWENTVVFQGITHRRDCIKCGAADPFLEIL